MSIALGVAVIKATMVIVRAATKDRVPNVRYNTDQRCARGEHMLPATIIDRASESTVTNKFEKQRKGVGYG